MGIPSTSEPVAHLVSEETARRIDTEAEREGFEWTIGGDMSVGALVRERYGDDVVDNIVSSLLGGVYSCTADDLGVRATVPQLAALIGTLLREFEAAPTFGMTDAEAIARREAALAACGLPAVQAVAPELARFDANAEFEYMLELSISAVEGRLPQQ